MNIVTMVRLRTDGQTDRQTDRQTDTGEFRFLDPILNSLGNTKKMFKRSGTNAQRSSHAYAS